MVHTLDFGGEDADVTVTTSGMADAAGFAAMNDELVAHPRFRPGMSILVDHSALDVTLLRAGDVQVIARAVTEMASSIGPGAIAIVAPTKVGFGVARMSEGLAAPAELRTRTFRSRAHAIEWLRDQRGGD
jgi:hypothetical protein